jgi:hypothetical protein
LPITCTETPHVLRVGYTAFEDDFIRREAVCFLKSNQQSGQLEIFYSHHTDFTRPSESGPWVKTQDFKVPLSPVLISEITSRVLYEFWNAFGLTVRDLPAGIIKVPIAEQQLQGGTKFV